MTQVTIVGKETKEEQKAKEKYPYTHKIEFLGVGKSENGDRYLRRRVGTDVALISVPKLLSDATEEFVRLQRVGVILPEQVDRRELMGRVRLEASEEPTFNVATEPGLLGDDFFFPDGPASGKSNNAFYPDEKHLDTYRKFRRAGSRAGWKRLLEMAKGNSRLILGYALACAGPICGAFGYEPPGIQFVGKGGVGKTPLARIIAAIWGWDPTPSTRLGFGTSWKMKPGGLEVVAGAYNHTFIYLDEMSKATAEQVEFVMTIAQGQGTARMTELRRRIWCMPILSTSNKSVVELMKKLGLEFDEFYVDRLMDVPSPSQTCFVENLHDLEDIAAFAARTCQLAEKNYGWAGRELAAKFVHALRVDREELKSYVEAARADYVIAAAGITSSWRDLVRVHGRFATIYASGCVAIRFGVLPFTQEGLLAAILVCERDHVAFVDQEVRRLGALLIPAPGAQGVKPTLAANEGFVGLAKTPLIKLNDYLAANIPNGLIDLRGEGVELPENHDHAKAPGYIGIHDKKIEIWLSNDRFEKIAGGRRKGNDLKKLLEKARCLMMWQRGKGATSKVVQRRIAGLGEQSVVAFKPSRAVLKRMPKLNKA